MNILLVERDRLLRDQIKVGLQQFPGFQVTLGEGYSAINELRQVAYDCVFLGVPSSKDEGRRLLEHLRSFDRTTEVVVITTNRAAKDMAGEKGRLAISGFVHAPLDPHEFFRFIGRFRERRLQKTGG